MYEDDVFSNESSQGEGVTLYKSINETEEIINLHFYLNLRFKLGKIEAHRWSQAIYILFSVFCCSINFLFLYFHTVLVPSLSSFVRPHNICFKNEQRIALFLIV